MSYFLTFMHELGHAVVLARYGRRVKSAGFMIYFGSPAFFVDSSDGLMMDRRQRIVQSFAGPYAELIIAGAAAGLAWAFPDWSAIAPCSTSSPLLNYFVIFLNLVPLLELDGYWILSDLIQVPDLRPRSLAVHALRPVAESSAPGALHEAGGRARLLRDPRRRVHDLDALWSFCLLGGDLRRAGPAAVERRASSAGSCWSRSRCS